MGEDYFCESAIKDDISGDLTQFDSTFFFRDCLWDGDGCADSNNVARGSVTHISSKIWLPQLQRISISVSVVIYNDVSEESFAIELIEIYVQ